MTPWLPGRVAWRRVLISPSSSAAPPTPHQSFTRLRAARRNYTSSPQPPPPPPPPSSSDKTASRLSKIISRLPKPLRPYASRLQSAPLSHAAAFLVLHEITAVVPLLALFGLFHYTDLHVAPVGWVSERYGPYVQEGLGKFERYFRRKGWFGFSDIEEGSGRSIGGNKEEVGEGGAAALHAAEGPYRVVVEVALAYAITKALLPLRIAASVWATPWFAGVLVRARGVFRRK